MSPGFHYSPITTKDRAYGPISKEGFIPAGDFNWVNIVPRTTDFPKGILVLIRNPGRSSTLLVVPIGRDSRLRWQYRTKANIQAQWEGWVKIDSGNAPPAKGFRIIFPKGRARFLLGGIVFGDDDLHWPWAQRADVILMGKDPNTGRVVLSFDPARILPPPLNRLKISILNDNGSSVLFRIDR